MAGKSDGTETRPPGTGRHFPARQALVWLALAVLVIWVLRVGRPFILPFVLALLALYLIDVTTALWRRLRVGGRTLPAWLARALAIAAMLAFMAVVFGIIADNANEVAAAAPRYQDRLRDLAGQLSAELGVDGSAAIDWVRARLDFGRLVAALAAGVGGLLGNAALVLAYLFFLMLERRYFGAKLAALVPDPGRREAIRRLLAEVDRDVRVYIGVKTLVSLLTAVLSFAIMRAVALDFAAFWALLIFVLNFIPNIGSLVATALPTLLALVQFDHLRPFLVVGVGVTAVQLLVANVIEPPLMGRSLNMSPLVVVLSLVFWGLVWGTAGLFLAVPVTAIGVIVCARFEPTRWIAVLLSEDGRLRGDAPGN